MRISKLVITALVLHLLPIAAWAAFKPIRVVAPELLGLHCASSGVCVDDQQRLAEAEALRQEALAFVNRNVGTINNPPRTIFCATMACTHAFGFTNNAAYNVATWGIVISYRGWQPYFVRHELIHHLQNERLGTLNAWLLKPSWLIEGMAYTLSEDPRQPLPSPLEQWRDAFTKWRTATSHQNLWQAAELVNQG